MDIKETVILDGFLKIIRADIVDKDSNFSRLCMERGDAVAVLVYDSISAEFIFVKQFRYPSHRRGISEMLEIPAGSLKQNEDPITCAKRECIEEIGYNFDSIRALGVYFSSPGGTSERIHLFLARATERVSEGGGLEEENESIEVVKLNYKVAFAMLQRCEIVDMKTALALSLSIHEFY